MRKKWFLLLILITSLSLLILPGCTSDSKTMEEATYIGSDACITCHQDVDHGFSLTNHAGIFNDLDEYPVDWNKVITIWEETEEGNFKSAEINLKDAYGVMLDHYVVSKVDGFSADYYRVAQLEETENGFEIVPIGVKDESQDDWLVKGYVACADCHSPGLSQEGLGVENLDFGMSCETCHGPGSIHAQTKKKEAIVVSEEACIKCHTLGEPSEAEDGDYLLANTHYGVRNWFASDHYTSGYLTCLTCHTPHSTNKNGIMLKQDSFDENCATCHGSIKFNQDEIMWINPGDPHNHFTRDHSFGKFLYKDLGDDPETDVLEITNPEVIKELRNLSKGGS